MSLIEEWAGSIADFGGALVSDIGASFDVARAHHETTERKVLGKTANRFRERNIERPIKTAVGGGLKALDYGYHYGMAPALTAAFEAPRIARERAGDEGPLAEWSHLMFGGWSGATPIPRLDSAFGEGLVRSMPSEQIGEEYTGKNVLGEKPNSPMQALTNLLYTSTLAPGGAERGALSRQEFDKRYKDDFAYNAISGPLDFASRWYLDPANILGRAGAVHRTIRTKAPIGKKADISQAVETGRTGNRVRSIIDGTKNWNTHQFYIGVQGLKDSTGGMAIASALSKANKIEDLAEREHQMKLVQRVMYGDQSAKAELAKRNSSLMDQLAASDKKSIEILEANKWEDLGNGKSRYWDKPEMQALYSERLKNQKNLTAEIESEIKRLDEMGTAFGSVRDRTLKVTAGSRVKANRYGQSEFAAARDEFRRDFGYNPFRVGTIRHSLWSVPVRVVSSPLSLADAMVTTAPNGYVHLHDPRSAQQLDAMMSSVKDFDPALKSKYVSDFINAGEEGGRQAVIDHAETALFGHIAKKHGLDKDTAAKLVREYQVQRMGWRNRAKMYAGIGQNESYSAAPSRINEGLTADSFLVDGEVIRVPLLSTHLRNSVPVLDTRMVDHVMKRNVNKFQSVAEWADRAENAFGRGTSKVVRRADATRWGLDELRHDGLNLFNRIWKFGVLFRLGYPLRNITDEQLRMWAYLDSGIAQLYVEAGLVTGRNIGRAITGKTRREAKAAFRADVDKFDELTDALSARSVDPEAKVALKLEHKVLGDKLQQARKGGYMSVYKPAKARVGQQDITLPDGSVIPGAFGDESADLYRELAGGHGLGNRLIHQGENNNLARATALGGDWVDIAPTDPGHAEAWLDAINNQIAQDPLAAKILAGDSDSQIIKWLKTDPKGREMSRRLPHHAANKADWVANARSHVESYLPDPEWGALLGQRKLTGKDLKSFTDNGGHAPRVNGPSLEYALGNGPVAGLVNRFMDRSMKYLSDLPAQKFSRHPFYAALYQKRAMEEADFLLADPTRSMRTGKRVDALDAEDLEHIKRVSHQHALREMKATLYDISAHSDAAQAMRFMSPFMGAWQETLGRWWGLAKDKPQILNYFNLAWQTPNKMGLVVDREGHPVPDSEGISDDEFLVLRLPEWAGGKEFKMFDSIPYIPKSSFNLALQGDPWWLPGFGPLVQIPVGYFQTRVPQVDEVATFVNPFGPPRDVWDALSPATVKRLRSYFDGPAAKDFGQDNYRIFNQMVIDWEKGGREGPRPTWGEAESRTKHLYLVRTANNFLNPFPASFRSPYQAYIDGYKILQEQSRVEGRNPEWADDKFIEKYGDTFFVLAQSMSKNNARLDPTAEAVKAYKKYKNIIDEHPEYISQIVGDQEGEFNSSAYAYQLNTRYEPGTDKTMRSLKSPKEAQLDNEARLGWIKYRKFVDGLDAIANERGLQSYREAEDLMAMKKVATDKLAKDNPSWAQKYNEASSARTFDLQIPELTDIANDKRLLNDPMRTDVKSLQKYLAVRDIIGKILAERAKRGEPGGPTALANQPLMQLFTAWAHKLAGSDTKFSANWFNGKLEFDPMLVDLTKPEVAN